MARSAASPIAEHGERKFAVLMFADLTGYTELCRRLDPEDVAATVRPVMAAMRSLVEAVGGVVPSIAGDGFMAVFGIPRTDELIAEQAVEVAGRLRALIAERNAATRTFRIPDVHVGIAAGEVLVVPSDESVGWSLVGQPVNLASRLCSAAGPDEVLFDTSIRDLLRERRLDAQRREITVPGVSDSLAVWSLDRIHESSAPSVAAAQFVNRVAILQRLDGTADDAANSGMSRVALIAGEAGIGKSRTAQHWIRDRALQHVWVWCGATSGGSALTRIVDELAKAAGVTASLPRERIDDLSPVRDDPFPAVVAAGRRVLEDFAEVGGSVVVFDDAHLADPSVIAFLRGLRDAPVSGGLAVLVTWRSDEVDPPWQPEIVLEPLLENEASLLLASSLGAEPPAALRSAIIERINGHPLMAVQSAAYLIEAGVVVIEDGVCRLERPDAVDVLPTSLRLFVSARIDRLPTAAKAALQELSTFGERVGRSAVERVCGKHVHAAIPTLIDRGLLRESDAGWRFSHGLVQQVAYASLPRSVRAELHRRQAQFHRQQDTGAHLLHSIGWAESVSPNDPDQCRSATREALEAADQHAHLLYATQAADAHSVVRRVAGLLTDYQQLFPVQATLLYVLDARSLIEMGRFEDALLASDRALALFTDVDGRSRIPALLARGHALSRLRRFQAARQSLEEALAIADTAEDAVARGQTLRLLGDTYRHASYPDFLRLTEQAYQTLAEAGDRAAAGECACILAYLRSVSTQFDRWRRIAADYVLVDDYRGQLWLARADLEAHHARRNHEAALAAAREAVRLGRRIVAVDGLADGLAGIARSACALGDLVTALDAAEELRSLAIEHSNPRMRLVAGTELVSPMLRTGRLDEALAELDSARIAADAFGAVEEGVVALVAGGIARDRGQWTEAATHLARARDLCGNVSGFDVLFVQVLEASVHSVLAQPPSGDYMERLATECADAGAPSLASFASAVAEQGAVVAGQSGDLVVAAKHACLEELAIRAETAALLAERSGEDATPSWRAAAGAWGQLGYTIFLARAQVRAGDESAAAQTLDAIGADETARAWALQG